MCTPGVGPSVLYISWMVGGTLAVSQASDCLLALPRWDAMLGQHHPAWGECKMPRGGLNAQILRFGHRKAGSTGEARLAVTG